MITAVDAETVPVFQWLTYAGLAVVVIAGVLWFAAWRARSGEPHGYVLAATSSLAIGALLIVIGWSTSPEAPAGLGEAIRNGALMSGAVLAFYALWLNDRRRRTEQERQEIEAKRHEVEVKRLQKELDQVDYDRLHSLIELLGDDSPPVRMGGLLNLRKLARDRPDLVCDVVNQMCAYLKVLHPDDPIEPTGPVDQRARAERLARITAQSVLEEVLGMLGEGVEIEVDLSDTVLENLSLDNVLLRRLCLDRAVLVGSTSLVRLVAGSVSMVGTEVRGPVNMDESSVTALSIANLTFGGRFSAQSATFGPGVRVRSCTFAESVLLNEATFVGNVIWQAEMCMEVILSAARFVPENEHGRAVTVDLSGNKYHRKVQCDGLWVAGTLVLDNSTFDGDLELPERHRVRAYSAESARARKGAELRLPGWHEPVDLPGSPDLVSIRPIQL